ncbi:MAG TPA: hypothetical protein VKA49_12525 [Flavitalea sp.]|nr:hypothetical protein [Flavitalea sp.]
MKQLQFTIAFILCGFFYAHTQTSSGPSIPDDFTAGTIVMPDNTIQQGYIKNNMKKTGEIIFLSADGKKMKYTASQVSGATVDNNSYITMNNAFYKVVADGSKIKLLRKASNSSTIQYNGSEPIIADAGEGSYDDYFIQTVGTKKLQLVRKKDFAKIFTSVCADCTTLTDDLRTNKLGFDEIEQAVALYNTCVK